MNFKVFKSGDEWRFRIVAKNGRTVAQSEGYKNRADCLETVRTIRAEAASAKVVIRPAKEKV